jgi:asparagine synthase (glutamine-hydrolysing)
MPGIVGLITKLPQSEAETQLRRMLKTLLHEPFYVSGTWADSEQGIYVGWATRKGSFDDGMPLQNESGDRTLLFSGEEFPEPGINAALRARGHNIGASPASYLVHRYEEEPDFPRQLNGRFHGLAVDARLGRAVLFNDRFGLQRLYYHEARDCFYFAAEAKAILAVRPDLRSTDARGLGEFIVCGCVLENRTLFRGIHVLPPGSAWVFQSGALRHKASYFDPKEWEAQERLAPEPYYAALRAAFVGNLERYFTPNEPLGVSLTGGLDTRIIMAWRKSAPGSLPCYTFGSMYRDNQDVILARKIAQICGQPHQVITTGQDFLARFAHYAERSIYLTDACVDLSRSPDLYVNERARDIAPVRIVGTYGSEMLLRSVMFKATPPAPGIFHSDLSPQIQRAGETYYESQKVHPVTFVAFRQSPWHHFGVLGLEQTQIAIRSPYLDNDVVKVVYQAPDSVEVNEASRLRLLREGSPELAAIRTDRGIGGNGNPFLHGLLEFLFKAEYAYDYGMPQWVACADHIFSPLRLERLWLGRHKVFHFRIWYRDQLAPYVHEVLLDRRSLARPYISPDRVRAIVAAHTRGGRNYTIEIHRLLTLELAHRLFVDAQ